MSGAIRKLELHNECDHHEYTQDALGLAATLESIVEGIRASIDLVQLSDWVDSGLCFELLRNIDMREETSIHGWGDMLSRMLSAVMARCACCAQ